MTDWHQISYDVPVSGGDLSEVPSTLNVNCFFQMNAIVIIFINMDNDLKFD